MTYWIDPNMAMQVEMMYTRKTCSQGLAGYQPSPGVPAGGYTWIAEVDWEIRYLEIPVLFRWATSERVVRPDGSKIAGSFEPFFECGPGFSVLLGARHWTDMWLATAETPPILPEIDYINFATFMMTLNVGVGANLNLGPGMITAQARFSSGFEGYGNHPDSVYPVNIWLLLGYGFSFQ
jgi:hypothetical protein